MKTVRLVALGPSATEVPRFEEGVEVFGIQYTWQHFKLTRAFVMDDPKWIIAKNHSYTNPLDVEKDMREAGCPIYTSQKWENVPNTVEYPIEEIKKEFPVHYFMNSMAYMFALAIHEGFERIETYGIDLRYISELGKEMKYHTNWLDETHCGAFWAGVAIGRGIEVVTPKRSSLMKPVSPGETSIYGYEISPTIEKQRAEILASRKKAVETKTEEVMVFRPPKGMDQKEFLKQVSVGALKPVGTAKIKPVEDENKTQNKTLDTK